MAYIKPIKSLGQNFLRDQNIQLKIIDALDLRNGDNVLEIGPGEGAITDHLIRAGVNLTVVDKDSRSADLLTEKYRGKDIDIVNHDILTYDGLKTPSKVIGNLPYYISSQILFYLFERRDNLVSAVIMLQKEVAERLLSDPGTKEYGKLSVLLQTFFIMEKVTDVSPNCFFPKPNVWSSVIKLSPKEVVSDSISDIDTSFYWSIVKSAFAQRRKQMTNTLKHFHGFTELDELSKYHKMRPERLSTDDFLFIYEKLRGR